MLRRASSPVVLLDGNSELDFSGTPPGFHTSLGRGNPCTLALGGLRQGWGSIAHAIRISQARQRAMTAHLISPRRQIRERQHPQARQQNPRLDAERSAEIIEAEDIRAPGPAAGFKPVPDLDEVAAAFAVCGIDVAQVASNRVFEHGQQQFQLAFDDVISPHQIDILPGQQKSGVDSFSSDINRPRLIRARGAPARR